MLTPRDRRLVLQVGLHGWLSHSQIQQLAFTSYDMVQRRIREELLPNKFLERFYLTYKDSQKRTPIFRLGREGADIYQLDTDEKPKIPRFSQLKVPHRLAVNQVLVELKKKDLISIVGFELEKKLGTIRPDAFVCYEKPFCLEVDLSGGEIKSFIQKKWQQYEREFMQGNLKCKYVVWCSSRSEILYKWIDRRGNLTPVFINRGPEEILKAIDYIDHHKGNQNKVKVF